MDMFLALVLLDTDTTSKKNPSSAASGLNNNDKSALAVNIRCIGGIK
jgi:hypothetical protein